MLERNTGEVTQAGTRLSATCQHRYARRFYAFRDVLSLQQFPSHITYSTTTDRYGMCNYVSKWWGVKIKYDTGSISGFQSHINELRKLYISYIIECSSVHTMKACMGRRCIAPLILNLGSRWKSVVQRHTPAALLREINSIISQQESGRTPDKSSGH